MTSGDLRMLRDVGHRAGGRLYLGLTSDGGMALGEPQHALLILGPPRSGKTVGLVIPNVLSAPGAVVSTSTKTDVMSATWRARREVGRCWLFDPTGTVPVPAGVERVRWSPVCAAGKWDDALVA
ncbi:MAG: type IV secretory system conjugative DNA transfer family protein, partial [Acidimicrobiaceae bacterium]|nr:type IV secretory system conjugative DNA transfer family protein [Acidimicrobiaceae bacterium]